MFIAKAIRLTLSLGLEQYLGTVKKKHIKLNNIDKFQHSVYFTSTIIDDSLTKIEQNRQIYD